MAVFGKKDDIAQDLKKAESEAISSILDESVIVNGEISFKGKTRVDGQIKGNITGEYLILSKTGKIDGDAIVTSFDCHGELKGNAKANLVTLRKECTVTGKIEANSLTVEPGAVVDGEIKAAAKDLKTTQDKKITQAPEQ